MTTQIDDLPDELLCYIFTFLFWKRVYARFYGTFNNELVEYNVKSWAQLFRRRSAQLAYLEKLVKPAKVYSWDTRIDGIRMIGGPTRAVLVFREVKAGLPMPSICHLQTNYIEHPRIPANATCIMASENGRRLFVGTSSGEVHQYEFGEVFHGRTKVTNNTYNRFRIYSDGHNHPQNPYRSIEKIVENNRYLVSSATNNTVAIWEKLPPDHYDPHCFDLTQRREMRRVIDELEDYHRAKEVYERTNAEWIAHMKNLRDMVISIEKEIREARKKGETHPEDVGGKKRRAVGIRNQAWLIVEMRRENPSYDPFKKYFNTSLPEQTKAERPAVVDEDPAVISDEEEHLTEEQKRKLEQKKQREEIRVAQADVVGFGPMEPVRPAHINDALVLRYTLELSEDGPSVLVKSLVFKYPPSVIYLPPGDQLQVVIGLQSGTVLVWESLGNFLLKAHEGPVTHCVAFDKDEDRFLVTLSASALDLAVWDLNSSRTVSRTGKERMLCRVKLTKPPLKLFWNATHEHLILVTSDCVQVWDLYTPGALRKSSTGKLVFLLYEIDRPERKVTAAHVDDTRSLLYVAYDDSAIWVYFVATGQLVAKLAPTKSNQYFTIFAMTSDDHTFVAADDFCLHWRPIEKRVDKENHKHWREHAQERALFFDSPNISNKAELGHPMYINYPGENPGQDLFDEQ